MAKIEVLHAVMKTIELPTCFCGDDPDVCVERSEGDNRYKQRAWIECPYCQARSKKYSFDLDSINSKYEAIAKAASDWCAMIRNKED